MYAVLSGLTLTVGPEVPYWAGTYQLVNSFMAYCAFAHICQVIQEACYAA